MRTGRSNPTFGTVRGAFGESDFERTTPRPACNGALCSYAWTLCRAVVNIIHITLSPAAAEQVLSGQRSARCPADYPPSLDASWAGNSMLHCSHASAWCQRAGQRPCRYRPSAWQCWAQVWRLPFSSCPCPHQDSARFCRFQLYQCVPTLGLLNCTRSSGARLARPACHPRDT